MKLFLKFSVAIMLIGLPQAKAQYTLTDDDVIIVEGRMESCSYNFQNKDIVIPDILDGQQVTVIGIGDNNMLSSKDLVNITFPSTALAIGESAFEDNKFTSITLPNGLVSIGDKAFFGNNIVNINIPNSVTYIGSMAFSNNALTSIILPVPAKQDSTFLNWNDSIPGNTEVSNFAVSYTAKFVKNTSVINSKDLQKLQLSLYPNPFVDVLHINIAEVSEISQIEIYSLNGERLYSMENVNSSFEINLSECKSGILFIRVIDKKSNSFTKKIIKQ